MPMEDGSWSEYLQVELHPRSLRLIPSHAHDDGEHPLGAFSLGWEIWSRFEAPWQSETVDAIRAYSEECDSLQVGPPLAPSVDSGSCSFSPLPSSVALVQTNES